MKFLEINGTIILCDQYRICLLLYSLILWKLWKLCKDSIIQELSRHYVMQKKVVRLSKVLINKELTHTLYLLKV